MVADVLLLAVALDGGGVCLAIPAPVVGVANSPLLRTVPAHLPVFRVCGDFLAVIIGTSPPLAVQFVANRLPQLIFRGLKRSFTVAASPFDHTGVVASAVDVFRREI